MKHTRWILLPLCALFATGCESMTDETSTYGELTEAQQQIKESEIQNDSETTAQELSNAQEFSEEMQRNNN